MTIEEIRYDFTEHVEKFHSFFIKIMKLIIISKLNCLESNSTSLNYFYELVSRIEGCETHKIKYGKTMIFTKFLGHEFNYHTVRVTTKVMENFTIEMRIESIIPDFVKIFDKISLETDTIKWNTSKIIQSIDSNVNTKREENTAEKEKNDAKGKHMVIDEKKEVREQNNIIKNEVSTTFMLLESFIESLYILISLPKTNPNSLSGKYVEIKDVSVTRKILNIELVVDENTIILDLYPRSKNRVVVSIDNEEKTGNTLREIMLQNVPAQ